MLLAFFATSAFWWLEDFESTLSSGWPFLVPVETGEGNLLPRSSPSRRSDRLTSTLDWTLPKTTSLSVEDWDGLLFRAGEERCRDEPFAVVLCLEDSRAARVRGWSLEPDRDLEALLLSFRDSCLGTGSAALPSRLSLSVPFLRDLSDIWSLLGWL